METLKIAVIGGGSTYTPEFVSGLLERHAAVPIQELWLMDIDPNRLAVVGGFAERMVDAHGQPFRVILTKDQRAAVEGAAYVVTQLRVGGMAARRADEYLGRRHGLIGQETTGIGGMAKALRTIPPILQIAADVRRSPPTGRTPLLLNFTNPAGLVTEALARHAPDIPTVGVCNTAIGVKMAILAEINRRSGTAIEPERAVLLTLGLNHLTWHRGFTIDGEDWWPRLFPLYLDHLRRQPEPPWEVELVETLGMIPNDYLRYYYYTGRMLQEQQKWPPSRAEQVMEIEKSLLLQYADPNLTTPPPDLMKRGGAHYSTLAVRLIDSHLNDRRQVHVVNMQHGGAVEDWPIDWVVEMPVQVDQAGMHPLPAGPLPPACFGLVEQVKMYELLTVEAAVRGDRQMAGRALLTHPLGPKADRVEAVLDDLLATNRSYLPQFYDCRA